MAHLLLYPREDISYSTAPTLTSNSVLISLTLYFFDGFDELMKACFVFFIGGSAWAASARFVNHISVTTLKNEPIF